MHPPARRFGTLPLLMAAALAPPVGRDQPAEPHARPDTSPEPDEITRLLDRHAHYAAAPPACCLPAAGAGQRERRPRRRGQKRAARALHPF